MSAASIVIWLDCAWPGGSTNAKSVDSRWPQGCSGAGGRADHDPLFVVVAEQTRTPPAGKPSNRTRTDQGSEGSATGKRAPGPRRA